MIPQAVEVGNASGCDYRGWVRVDLPSAPPWRAAWSADHSVLAVAGERDDDRYPLELHVALPAAARRTVDLAVLVGCVRPAVQLQAMVDDWSPATLAGAGLVWAPVAADAAGAVLRLSGSHGPWHVTLEVRWWPNAVAHAVEVAVTAADYAMPAAIYSSAVDLVVTLPDATLWGPHGNGIVLPRATPMHHGETLRTSMTAVWPKRMATPADWSTACAIHLRGPWAVAR